MTLQELLVPAILVLRGLLRGPRPSHSWRPATIEAILKLCSYRQFGGFHVRSTPYLAAHFIIDNCSKKCGLHTFPMVSLSHTEYSQAIWKVIGARLSSLIQLLSSCTKTNILTWAMRQMFPQTSLLAARLRAYQSLEYLVTSWRSLVDKCTQDML